MRLRLMLMTILVSSLLIMSCPLYAQETTVPDVTGLNAPQAAAVLNQAGLRLGTLTSDLWTTDAPVPANTIGSQSPEVGDSVAMGAAVHGVILRAPNVTLRYDENDFTLINRSGLPMSQLRGLTFAASETTRPAEVTIRYWGIAGIDGDDCLQIWSIGRNSPKEWEGCHTYYWQTTQNPEYHFWTQLNGVTTFHITLNGVEYGACPAAAAGSEPQDCNIYLPADGSSEVTAFVEFRYTPAQFVVHNRAPDQWMMLAGLAAGGVGLGDTAVFAPTNAIALTNQLAPDQCLVLGEGQPALPCEAIARGSVAPFWTAPFTLSGAGDGIDRTCPAATAGSLTICILPR